MKRGVSLNVVTGGALLEDYSCLEKSSIYLLLQMIKYVGKRYHSFFYY